MLAATAALGGLAQSLAGAAGGLLATDLGGSSAWAGAPQTSLTVGAAAAAVPLAGLTARAGRATSLAAGCLVAALGCAVVVAFCVLPAQRDAGIALTAVLVGSALLGAGNTAVMLSRYAGPPLRPALKTARALAAVMAAVSIGAVLGPNLLAPAARLTHVLFPGGAPHLVGAYFVGGGVYLLAAGLAARLRRNLPPAPPALGPPLPPSPPPLGWVEVGGRRHTLRSFLAGLVTLSLSNLVMVGVMTMAPVEMRHHGAGLPAIGLVVSAHIAAMFAPAGLSGRLTSRLGAACAARLAAGVLVVACLTAAAFSDTALLLAVGMVLLGGGWNLALVAGSTLLTDGVPEPARPHRESLGEIGSGAAAVLGGLGASLVAGTAGYPTLSLAGAGVSVVLALLVRRPPGPRTAAPPTRAAKSTAN